MRRKLHFLFHFLGLDQLGIIQVDFLFFSIVDLSPLLVSLFISVFHDHMSSLFCLSEDGLLHLLDTLLDAACHHCGYECEILFD